MYYFDGKVNYYLDDDRVLIWAKYYFLFGFPFITLFIRRADDLKETFCLLIEMYIIFFGGFFGIKAYDVYDQTNLTLWVILVCLSFLVLIQTPTPYRDFREKIWTQIIFDLHLGFFVELSFLEYGDYVAKNPQNYYPNAVESINNVGTHFFYAALFRILVLAFYLALPTETIDIPIDSIPHFDTDEQRLCTCPCMACFPRVRRANCCVHKNRKYKPQNQN